jgi:hypothetical protein
MAGTETAILVVVVDAPISGTCKPALPLPLRRLRNASTTLDNRLRLDHKNSSKCRSLIAGRSGCRRPRSSSRTVRRTHRLLMAMQVVRVPCQSSKVTLRSSLQARISLGRKMGLVAVERAITS